jgi:hypothetical protein
MEETPGQLFLTGGWLPRGSFGSPPHRANTDDGMLGSQRRPVSSSGGEGLKRVSQM